MDGKACLLELEGPFGALVSLYEIWKRRWLIFGSAALAGGVYGFVDAYGQKFRKKDDAMGKFTAGCAAGFMLGMQGLYLVDYCIDAYLHMFRL